MQCLNIMLLPQANGAGDSDDGGSVEGGVGGIEADNSAAAGGSDSGASIGGTGGSEGGEGGKSEMFLVTKAPPPTLSAAQGPLMCVAVPPSLENLVLVLLESAQEAALGLIARSEATFFQLAEFWAEQQMPFGTQVADIVAKVRAQQGAGGSADDQQRMQDEDDFMDTVHLLDVAVSDLFPSAMAHQTHPEGSLANESSQPPADGARERPLRSVFSIMRELLASDPSVGAAAGSSAADETAHTRLADRWLAQHLQPKLQAYICNYYAQLAYREALENPAFYSYMVGPAARGAVPAVRVTSADAGAPPVDVSAAPGTPACTPGIVHSQFFRLEFQVDLSGWKAHGAPQACSDAVLVSIQGADCASSSDAELGPLSRLVAVGVTGARVDKDGAPFCGDEPALFVDLNGERVRDMCMCGESERTYRTTSAVFDVSLTVLESGDVLAAVDGKVVGQSKVTPHTMWGFRKLVSGARVVLSPMDWVFGEHADGGTLACVRATGVGLSNVRYRPFFSTSADKTADDVKAQWGDSAAAWVTAASLLDAEKAGRKVASPSACLERMLVLQERVSKPLKAELERVNDSGTAALDRYVEMLRRCTGADAGGANRYVGVLLNSQTFTDADWAALDAKYFAHSGGLGSDVSRASNAAQRQFLSEVTLFCLKEHRRFIKRLQVAIAACVGHLGGDLDEFESTTALYEGYVRNQWAQEQERFVFEREIDAAAVEAALVKAWLLAGSKGPAPVRGGCWVPKHRGSDKVYLSFAAACDAFPSLAPLFLAATGQAQPQAILAGVCASMPEASVSGVEGDETKATLAHLARAVVASSTVEMTVTRLDNVGTGGGLVQLEVFARNLSMLDVLPEVKRACTTHGEKLARLRFVATGCIYVDCDFDLSARPWPMEIYIVAPKVSICRPGDAKDSDYADKNAVTWNLCGAEVKDPLNIRNLKGKADDGAADGDNGKHGLKKEARDTLQFRGNNGADLVLAVNEVVGVLDTGGDGAALKWAVKQRGSDGKGGQDGGDGKSGGTTVGAKDNFSGWEDTMRKKMDGLKEMDVDGRVEEDRFFEVTVDAYEKHLPGSTVVHCSGVNKDWKWWWRNNYWHKACAAHDAETGVKYLTLQQTSRDFFLYNLSYTVAFSATGDAKDGGNGGDAGTYGEKGKSGRFEPYSLSNAGDGSALLGWQQFISRKYETAKDGRIPQPGKGKEAGVFEKPKDNCLLWSYEQQVLLVINFDSPY